MKLSKMLISSGVLASGRVRHCSDWDLSTLASNSRFHPSRTLRAAALRRSQPIPPPPRRERVFSWIAARLPWKVGK